MITEIESDYFDLTDDCLKKHYFDTARIKCGVVFDYAYRLGEQLKEVRKSLKEGV